MKKSATTKTLKPIEQFIAQYLFENNPELTSVYTYDLDEFFGKRTIYVSTGEVPAEQEHALKDVSSLSLDGKTHPEFGNCQAVLVSFWEIKESKWTRWERGNDQPLHKNIWQKIKGLVIRAALAIAGAVILAVFCLKLISAETSKNVKKLLSEKDEKTM